MSKLSRAIAGGVGLGMQQFGASMLQIHNQEQANARTDARLEKTDAFKERELVAREDELLLRKQAAERQAKFDNFKLLHDNLTKSVGTSGGNVKLELKAFSDFFPNQRQYTLNQGARDSHINDNGQKPFMVVDVGVFDEDATTGELIPDPLTGEPQQVMSKLGPLVFWRPEDYEEFKVKMVGADAFLAAAVQNRTRKEAIGTDIAVSNAIAEGTVVGQAEIEKSKSVTELNKQKTEDLKRKENLPLSEKLAKIKEQGINQFRAGLSKQFGVEFSKQQALRVESIYDKPKVRAKLQKAAEKALNSDDPATKSGFIKWGTENNLLPREWLEEFYRQAEINYNNQAKDAIGSDGWIRTTLGSFLDKF
jgi:hypothetical protein